jgi:phytoene dehydrogenase-like protein
MAGGSIGRSVRAGRESYDAVVVGAGPNGLAAAITLAREGLAVLVVEAGETVGGGMRSAGLTLPGFVHDVCSAVHPMAVASPFFQREPLGGFGLEMVHPPTPLAHPLDDGSAVALERSVDETARGLGPDDRAYRRLFGPLIAGAGAIFSGLLGPLCLKPMRHPLTSARFGLRAVRSARGLASSWFKGERARALFAGLAAHAVMPLNRPPTAAIGLMLTVAGHSVGWPIARGGSQRIADALADRLRSLGGEVVTGWRVDSLDELPAARAVLCDLVPRDLARVAGDRLPAGYRRALGRYRHGPGVFKLDWALDGPIPWAADTCRRAGTVHLGGTLDEIAAAEADVWAGGHPDPPFVLLAQPSLFDPTRAPEGKQTGWAYCHVPAGSTEDMTARIEAQVERFAPGFRDRILARSAWSTADFERYNPNYPGGDLTGGVADLRQLFFRPVARAVPYATPARGLYLCSSSTPPGAGVHGLCGFFAARAALARVFGKTLQGP